MDYLQVELDDLLKRGLWSRLLADAALLDAPEDADEGLLGKALRRLSHIDDAQQIRFLLAHLQNPPPPGDGAELIARRLNMFHLTLFGGIDDVARLEDAEQRLRERKALTLLGGRPGWRL